MGQLNVFLGGFDIGGECGRVGSVIIESAAQAPELDGGIGEASFDFGTLGRREVDLDLMGMGGSEFDPLELRFRTALDDRFDVPIFGKVVGYGAQFHASWAGRGSGGGWGSDGPEGG